MKKIISVILIILSLLIISGCSNKKGSTPEEFDTKMTSMEFHVDTITSDVIAENMKVAKIADNKKYQIQYFEFVSIKDAKTAFDSNKSVIKDSKSNGAKEKNVTDDNYSFYSYDSNDQYACIARSGKTLVYVYANSEYKKEVKKVIKKINY